MEFFVYVLFVLGPVYLGAVLDSLPYVTAVGLPVLFMYVCFRAWQFEQMYREEIEDCGDMWVP